MEQDLSNWKLDCVIPFGKYGYCHFEDYFDITILICPSNASGLTPFLRRY